MGMVAGQPIGLWLWLWPWLNPFTSPFVLAETTPTPCTVPSTCPLVKVAIVGPASEFGWVQTSSDGGEWRRMWRRRIVFASRWIYKKRRKKRKKEKRFFESSFQNLVPNPSRRASAGSAPVPSKTIFTLVKTHVALGENTHIKRAPMPTVPA